MKEYYEKNRDIIIEYNLNYYYTHKHSIESHFDFKAIFKDNPKNPTMVPTKATQNVSVNSVININ